MVSSHGAPPRRSGKPPGFGLLVVALGLLGFSAYLLWYGTRHMDTEPLAVFIVPFPVGLGALGYFSAKRFNKISGIAIVVVLIVGFAGFGAFNWQQAVERRAGFHEQWEDRRVALSLCAEGTPLPTAPAYDLASGGQTIHVIGSVYGDDRPMEWIPWTQDEYPAGWFSEALPHLVACLRNNYRVVETKSYEGSGGRAAFVAARQHRYDLELYEARTRTLVFQTQLEGGMPAPLSDSIRVQDGRSPSDQSGGRVGPSIIVPALEPFVGPR